MSEDYAHLRQQDGNGRSTRIFLAVAGHMASAGLFAYSLFLVVGAVMAISFCSAEAEAFGCAPSMKYLLVTVAPLGNLVGLVMTSAFTWMFKPKPRLRWLGVGLAVQVVTIIVAHLTLPLGGFRLF